VEFTSQQISTLERLQRRGFEIVAFPMYASHVGVRKGNCVALLSRLPSGTFKLFGTASFLVAGNLSVRVSQGGRDWFVWKKEKLEVTPARLTELQTFAAALSHALLPTA
jgi:hypothetical protein